MREATLAILIGMAQGWVLIPLALYVGLLVSRDLSQRHVHPHVLSGFIAPLAVTVLWLAMGYVTAERVLDIITDSRSIRQLWVVGGFFGLMGYATTMILIKKPGRPKNTA